jgi:murein endopeptidase
MRKLIIALTAIAALAAPALAEAASQPRQTTPVAPPVSTPKNIGSQSSGAGAGKVTFNPFSITRKVDRASPVFFAQ